MKLLQSHPDCLADFNRWVDNKKLFYSEHIVQNAQSMEQVLGLRYMFGELDAMRAEVMADVLEQAQLADLEGDEDGGGSEPDWC